LKERNTMSRTNLWIKRDDNKRKRTEAEERNAKYAALTPIQQLASLQGFVAAKQRAKIQKRIKEA